MCRSPNVLLRYSDNQRLKIKSFFVKFSGMDSTRPVPESLTLLYLPRINGTELEVSGSKIRPDSSAFVTLHRLVATAAKMEEGEVFYGSRERVEASGGVQFVVYFREDKVLKGTFRKNEDNKEWKLQCKYCEGCHDVAVADVLVRVEGHVELFGRVEIRRKHRRRVGFDKLEEIPEEREEEDGETEGGCWCTCDCDGSDGGDGEKGCDDKLEKEMDGVRWAVDLGIWVACLGVGILASKATSKSLRRLRLL
ncbi:hypothetical protein CFOL_v3_12222 [Cephalotus follicularis]|uniref:Uncharacterized protein n=1 Tax=Cephalotus follicularis TaxID=3775 RepID=A0A1Q3BLF0_CEPFO|nr:hypothetical protein CFOL_v3_12222 [Cephalotus follicularis]